MTASHPSDTLHLEWVGDVPVVRLADVHRVFEAAVDALAVTVRAVVAGGHPHLLIDASGVPFASPTLAQRVHMVRLWADAADGRLRIAMVAPPSFVDPERFGIVAAANFGLAAQVFVVEADAIAWLGEERAAELRRNRLPPVG